MIFKSLLTIGVLTILLSVCVCGEAEQPAPEQSGEPVVYFTSDISPEGLVRIYEKLDWTPSGKVGVKISTGEPPASNYLRPELIGDLVKKINGTIVECNTAYGGQRSAAKMHLQVVKDHGFLEIADFDLLDEEGTMKLPVTPGTHFSENIVGSHLKNYGSFLVLSHFKGHLMGGYGGAIKNASIGFASPAGKNQIHTHGKSLTTFMGGEQDKFLESMAEAAKSVSDYVGKEKMIYINVLNRISIDCDCNGNPAEPDIHDIGITASTDPVAVDQASINLVWKAEGNEALIKRINKQNGLHTIEHAEKIGFGSRTYKMINIDE